MTWPEVESYLAKGASALLPIGSTEQHGPMGLIGTDTICAKSVAAKAAEICDAIVAPAIAYTPAPFNTAFPGTLSVSPDLLSALVHEICQGLFHQGFEGVFIVNGHGANLDPVAAAIADFPEGAVKLRSWWQPQRVMELRAEFFGDWEGMHATPSEVAITQFLHGSKPMKGAETPPEKLSMDYIKAHAGDKHGPPKKHRAEFPDGRVGSHSALATPELGKILLDTAASEIAKEFAQFHQQRMGSAGSVV